MNYNTKKVAVIGGGSWATALVKLFANNTETVFWWMRNENAINHLLTFKHNPNYLQDVEFDLTKINLSSNLEEIIQQADIIVLATPAAFLTKTFVDFPAELLRDKIVFSAIKGIIPELSCRRGCFRATILLNNRLRFD